MEHQLIYALQDMKDLEVYHFWNIEERDAFIKSHKLTKYKEWNEDLFILMTREG